MRRYWSFSFIWRTMFVWRSVNVLALCVSVWPDVMTTEVGTETEVKKEPEKVPEVQQTVKASDTVASDNSDKPEVLSIAKCYLIRASLQNE